MWKRFLKFWARHEKKVNLILLAAAVLFPLVITRRYIISVGIMCGIYIILSLSMNLITGYMGIVVLGQAAFFGVGAYTAAIMATRFQTDFILNCILAALISVVFCVELVAKKILQTYYGPSALKLAAGNRLTDYADVIFSTVLGSVPILLVLLLPAILLCVFGRQLLGFERLDVRFAGLVLAGALVFHVLGLGAVYLPWKGDLTPKQLYHMDTNLDDQMEQLGLWTTLRLDMKHMIFPPQGDLTGDFGDLSLLDPGAASSSGGASSSQGEPVPVVDTSPNVMDVDLAALAENGAKDRKSVV